MATQDDPPKQRAELPLTAFELPKWLVEPAVRSCRLFNTTLDFIFYDVPTLRAALAEKDAPMEAQGEKPPSRILDFDALSDPEGSLLLIDATTAPYVHKYQSVKKFLESPYQETRDVDTATITGVGSSALGSAALAWDVSFAPLTSIVRTTWPAALMRIEEVVALLTSLWRRAVAATSMPSVLLVRVVSFVGAAPPSPRRSVA